MHTLSVGERWMRRVLLFASLLGLAACAHHSRFHAPKFWRHTSAAHSPRIVSVVSSDVEPVIPQAAWQPSGTQSRWSGALIGGGAAAGVGAGVCAPVFICPPCYPACVAMFGLSGFAVGSLGGHFAHQQLAFDPANRMLPAPASLSSLMRARVLANLNATTGLRAQDGGTASFDFARGKVAAPSSKSGDSDATVNQSQADLSPTATPEPMPAPSLQLEVALTEIRALAMRKGGFKIEMSAKARLRNLDTGKLSAVHEFEYSGTTLASGGGVEAEAARIQANVELGMGELATEMRSDLLDE